MSILLDDTATNQDALNGLLFLFLQFPFFQRMKIRIGGAEVVFGTGDEQFLGIHDIQLGRQRLPRPDQLLEIGKISGTVIGMRLMNNSDITVKNHRFHAEGFMERILPEKRTKPANQFRTIFLVVVIGGSVFQLIRIVHLYDIDLR